MQTALKDIGARIRKARIAAGINQAELAEKLNISPSHMSDIENGISYIGVMEENLKVLESALN